MVVFSEKKLIIELEHSNPQELLRDLKVDIIHILQLPSDGTLTEQEYQNAKNTLLTLLRHLVTGGNAGK